MSLNDPIADMLTRIRNAVRTQKPEVQIKNSKICQGIAKVLKDEGYVSDFDIIDDGHQGLIRIKLKYGAHGEQLINEIKRQSTPGRRIYTGVESLPRPMEGMGISIVSTSKGVLSDRQARAERVGGELLCTVE
jgi:small subunit ribosomal protein S8